MNSSASESWGPTEVSGGHLPLSPLRLLLRTGSGRGGGGAVAYRVAVDHEFHAAIALAPFGSVIGSDGLRFAEAPRGNRRSRNALIGQKIAHGAGAAFGK